MPGTDRLPPSLFRGVVWRLLRDWHIRSSLLGVAVFLLFGTMFSPWIDSTLRYVLQSVIILLIAAPLFRRGAVTLMQKHRLSIDLLMSISIFGAIIINELPEALALVVLYNLSEALEIIITDNAQRNVKDLMANAPETTTRLKDGVAQSVPASELEVGDTVLVQPGEIIPADGRVLEGGSDVDQSAITGESMPMWKSVSDEVFAGTLSGSGSLTVQVSRGYQDTLQQRIIHMVMEAQSSKSPTQRFIDRFAAIYTPLVALLATLVAILPPLLFNQPFLNPDPQTQGWLFRGLTLLVISCPCALVISTPVTIISAISTAARHGVIVKGGAHLEAISQARVVAFDKTGTLTRGRPRVIHTRSMQCRNQNEPCPACLDLLETASALESQSKHPLAGAVMQAAEIALPAGRVLQATSVQALTGSGIAGKVNEKQVVIGSHSYFDQNHPHPQDICREIAALEASGQTVMLVNVNDNMQGFFTAQDEIRPEAAAVIAELKRMGYHTLMLTGDQRSIGEAVGEKVGIDQVHAVLLPDEKLSHIELLNAKGAVIMVGDGMNDAPALAASDISISMGRSGSRQAMETADIVLLADNLNPLPFLLRLSRFTNHLLRMNITLSLGFKLAIFAITLLGLGSMWLAVLADTGLTVLVAMNGSRALRYPFSHTE